MDFLPSLTSLREMIPQKQVFEAFLKLLDEFNQTHETDRIQSFRRSRCLWKMRCLLRDNSMKPVWIEMRKQGVFGLKDKMLDCEIRIFERLDGLDERYIRAIPVRAQKLIADRAFNADWLPRIRSLIDSGRDLSATVYREEFLRDTDNSLEIDDDPGCCWINDYLEDMRRQLQPNSKPPHTVNLRCGEIANSDPHDNLSDSVEATYVDPPTPSRGRGQKATVKSTERIAVPEPDAGDSVQRPVHPAHRLHVHHPERRVRRHRQRRQHHDRSDPGGDAGAG